MEKSSHCTMCGTAEWEWELDRFAYEPVVKICRGCEIKESVSDQTNRQPGLSVELASSRGIEAARRAQAQQRLAVLRARDSDEDRQIVLTPNAHTPGMG